MKTEEILEKIENNFYRQKFLKIDIETLKGHYNNHSVLTEWIYGSKSDIKFKIKSKMRVLRRFQSSNSENIKKLAELNKKF